MEKTNNIVTLVDGKLTTVKVKATSTTDMNKKWGESYYDNYATDIFSVNDKGETFINGKKVEKIKNGEN